jgi:hypothetical protein
MDNEPKIVPLKDFLDAGFTEAFGITREAAWEQGICVECKQPPTFSTEAGKREYRLSAMCEPCFDKLMADPEEQHEHQD